MLSEPAHPRPAVQHLLVVGLTHAEDPVVLLEWQAVVLRGMRRCFPGQAVALASPRHVISVRRSTGDTGELIAAYVGLLEVVLAFDRANEVRTCCRAVPLPDHEGGLEEVLRLFT